MFVCTQWNIIFASHCKCLLVLSVACTSGCSPSPRRGCGTQAWGDGASDRLQAIPSINHSFIRLSETFSKISRSTISRGGTKCFSNVSVDRKRELKTPFWIHAFQAIIVIIYSVSYLVIITIIHNITIIIVWPLSTQHVTPMRNTKPSCRLRLAPGCLVSLTDLNEEE